jgi:hypothetical protein
MVLSDVLLFGIIAKYWVFVNLELKIRVSLELFMLLPWAVSLRTLDLINELKLGYMKEVFQNGFPRSDGLEVPEEIGTDE